VATIVKNKIGIDIGKTKTECCVISLNNEVLFRERLPTGTVFNEIKELYQKAIKYTDTTNHTIGVCMPGKLSNVSGLMINSSIEFLNNTDFVKNLQLVLNHDFKTANDSQCFALAEALLGAGKNYNIVYGLILGTGVGGGIVINGRSTQSEFGHTSLDSSNKILCRCKRIGCVETWLSGSGVDVWAKELLGIDMSTVDYMKDPKVKQIYFEKFGLALSNLIQTVNPECIVIGGGISNNSEVYSVGVERIKQKLFDDELSIPVVKAELGDSAGVIGAALL
jgi:fructokinase